MRKQLLVTVLLLAAAIAAWAALRARNQKEWTTSSLEALAELRQGLDAQRKYYWPEALSHFERALELDPEFTMAKLMLTRGDTISKERREKLRAELARTDRERLTAREAFLVELGLARSKEVPPAAIAKIVDDYLQEHPRDPYALEVQSDLYWNEGRWTDAEKSYQKLLAIDPNWVEAQNKMGYLSMAQGRFTEAEDRFRTYRFIAPDQANPHDSLGELLVLVGRFDEAENELEAALRIRPDFCSSYVNLIDAARLAGHPERVEGYLQRLEKSGCNEEWVASARCGKRSWELYLARDWEGLARLADDPCVQLRRIPRIHTHLAAVLRGDFALARRIEDLEAKDRANRGGDRNPALPHLAAVREVGEGNLTAALAKFESVDGLLTYRLLGDGVFKMYNRMQWARALELAGDHATADRLLREVESVNRAMASRYAGLPAPEPRGAAVAAKQR